MASRTNGLATTATSATTAGSASARPARRRGSWAKRVELTVLITPALVLFLGFVFLPIALAAYHGFYHWTGFSPPTWFGVQNYTRAFKDPVFLHAIGHNVIIAVLSLVLQLP